MSSSTESNPPSLREDGIDFELALERLGVSKEEKKTTKAVRDFNFSSSGIETVEITVTVEGEEITGKVCADAMALASPVWKKFMYPPWNMAKDTSSTNTKASPTTKVDFSEDNSDALLILLRIVHFQFHKLPEMLTRTQLFDIAVLADQYDCSRLLKPWLKIWLKVYERPLPVGEGPESSLLVCWVFGDEKRFSRVAMRLVKEAKVTGTGEYLTALGELFPEPSPPSIIESILEKRLDAIEALLAIPYSAMDKFASINAYSSQDGGRAFCVDPYCDATIYGSLQLGLQRVSLWPRKKPEEILQNIKELGAKIANIQVLAGSHSSCKKKFEYEQRVMDVLAGIESPVTRSQLLHMAAQKDGCRPI